MTAATVDTATDFAAKATRHDRNNFGLLRLFFASLVLVSHSYPLAIGNNNSEPFRLFTKGMSGGDFAVAAFFLISGYLVTQSWLRSRSPGDYIRKRILRIYPGYLIALTFTIGVAAVCAVGGPLVYLRQIAASRDDVLGMFLFLDSGPINNVAAFASNPIHDVANSSLWTLWPELRCYLILMGVGVLGGLRSRRVVSGLLAACFFWFAVMELRGGGIFSRLLTFFLVGSVLALSPHEWLRLTWIRAVGALAVLGAALLVPHGFQLALPWAAGYLILAIAVDHRSVGAAWFARHDLSYGIYLYAFVVQQAVMFFLHPGSPWLLSAIAMPITTVLAWCSWHYIESPAIRWKPVPVHAPATAVAPQS